MSTVTTKGFNGTTMKTFTRSRGDGMASSKYTVKRMDKGISPGSGPGAFMLRNAGSTKSNFKNVGIAYHIADGDGSQSMCEALPRLEPGTSYLVSQKAAGNTAFEAHVIPANTAFRYTNDGPVEFTTKDGEKYVFMLDHCLRFAPGTAAKSRNNSHDFTVRPQAVATAIGRSSRPGSISGTHGTSSGPPMARSSRPGSSGYTSKSPFGTPFGTPFGSLLGSPFGDPFGNSHAGSHFDMPSQRPVGVSQRPTSSGGTHRTSSGASHNFSVRPQGTMAASHGPTSSGTHRTSSGSTMRPTQAAPAAQDHMFSVRLNNQVPQATNPRLVTITESARPTERTVTASVIPSRRTSGGDTLCNPGYTGKRGGQSFF